MLNTREHLPGAKGYCGMRLQLLAAITALSAVSITAAQADIIVSAALTGTTIVSGGYNNIDKLGVFSSAGTDLTGSAIQVTFSYDVDLLNAAATNAINGSSYVLASDYEAWSDYANDGAVSQSVTIDGETYSQANSSPPSTGSVETYGWLELLDQNDSGFAYISTVLQGSATIAPGQTGTQAALDAFVGSEPTIYIHICSDVSDCDVFAANLSSAAPEPSTFAMIGGLVVVALGRRRFRHL
jgi:hypothetical protein